MIRELTTHRWRLRGQPGRRYRRYRGAHVHLAGRRDPRGARPVAAARFATAYGVTDEGNWEGVTILSRVWPAADEPPLRDDAGARGANSPRRARCLLARRATRPQPARDDKALAAWNGLAIAAFAEAGRLLGEERYTAAAVRAAETIVDGLLAADGSLEAVVEGRPRGRCRRARGLRAPRRGSAGAVRDDVRRALVLDRPRARRPDPGAVRRPGGRLLRHRERPRAADHAPEGRRRTTPCPSGGAMATTVLLRLAAWTGEGRYREAAETGARHGLAVPGALPDGVRAVARGRVVRRSDAVEVAIVGDPADPATRELLGPVWSAWRPNQVLAVAPADRAAVVRGAAAARPRRDRRPSDRLRLPQLCLQPAGHRRGGARGAAPRDP